MLKSILFLKCVMSHRNKNDDKVYNLFVNSLLFHVLSV